MAHRYDDSRRYVSSDSALTLAQGLGWFSIGLGLVEVIAPRAIAGFLGMERRSGLIRAYGVREIATGVGILAQDDPTPWIWGRVGGDTLDLATLATGFERANPRRGNLAAAVAAVAGVTVLDLICAQALSAEAPGRQRRRRLPLRDYSDRRGMPRPPDAMRGAASDFEVPRDMRAPEALRPFASAGPSAA